jgi:hypothetical protein
MSLFSFFNFQTYIQTNKNTKVKKQKDTIYFYYIKHEKNQEQK